VRFVVINKLRGPISADYALMHSGCTFRSLPKSSEQRAGERERERCIIRGSVRPEGERKEGRKEGSRKWHLIGQVRAEFSSTSPVFLLFAYIGSLGCVSSAASVLRFRVGLAPGVVFWEHVAANIVRDVKAIRLRCFRNDSGNRDQMKRDK